jgi:hypothetical protein
MQRLLVRGVRSEEFVFSAGSVGRLATTLMVLIRNHAPALPDDKDLIDELTNLRLRETAPGVLRIEHDPDKHDDRAIALALAAQKIVQLASPQPGKPARTEWESARARITEQFWEREDAEIAREDGRPRWRGPRDRLSFMG